MDNNQEWINLSNKEFEDKKYQNNGKTTGYFKMANGLWFSLPTYTQYISEWGEFIKDDNTEFKDGFINENGETNITRAKLKNTSFIVELKEWMSTILEIIQITPYELSSTEKRKILTNRIKKETGNENIEHLIFDIKENEFNQIIEMYYSQKGEQIREQRNSKLFNIVHYTFIDVYFNQFFKDFKTFKYTVLKKIDFLKIIQETEDIQYQDVKEYFDDNDKKEIENYIIEAEFYEKAITENDILHQVINYNKKKFGQLTMEMLEKYKNFISNIYSLNEYKTAYKEKVCPVERNIEITWLVDYFSGCQNKKYITGYDMPSLAVFDTDCIEIISQRKAKIFKQPSKGNENLLSAKQISSELESLSREGITDRVEEDLNSMIGTGRERI